MQRALQHHQRHVPAPQHHHAAPTPCWAAPAAPPCHCRRHGSSAGSSSAAGRRLGSRVSRAVPDEHEDASAVARRLERQRRREARQQARAAGEAADSSSSDEDDGGAQQQQSVAAAAGSAAAGAAARPARPAAAGSRLAARRQQRARRAPLRRAAVPAALVPDDVDEEEDEAAEDEEEDEEQEAGSSSDGDDEDARASSSGQAAEAAGSDDDAEAQQDAQLPQSVLQRASAGAGSGGGAQQRSSGGGGGGPDEGQRWEPLRLSERSTMYQPVLTDEDLAADPPDHKSGYVAVIGRPNAGKSTLINAVVGQKLSIVTYKPQTTRHRVVGIASGPDHQMILFDTPGIMADQRTKLDERMMAAVVSSIRAAEVIIAVVDAGDAPQEALAMFQPGPDWSGPPMAVLLNKADLLEPQQVEQLAQWYRTNCRAEQVFVGSALSSDDPGVVAIKAWAVGKLPEGPTLYPKSMVSEQPERFFVSEIIREQIFLQYEQEVPYACQVQIAEFQEHHGAKDFIQAVILVERESQAPIVLGRGGAAIKRLGSAARAQIEEFLGRPVYLELSVQVAPSWRTQADRLKDFGYFDAMYVS